MKLNNRFSLNFIALVVFATEQPMHCDRYRILLTYRIIWQKFCLNLLQLKNLILVARRVLFVRIH